MRFVVSSSTLLKHLNSVNGVITTNPVVPILENFLFEVTEGLLTVSASDLQTSMITEIPVDAKKKGSIAVPAKILLDTLKNLPEQPVTFSIDEETYSIEISSDNGRYRLSGENATDFPKVPAVKNGYSVEMPADVLNRAISSTLFAASNDELKPAMTGVYLLLSETNVTFVATDGHRLVKFRRVDVASDMANNIIIPKKALNLIKSSIPTDRSMVKLEFNASNAFFSFGNLKMICRLIDERFPDYENAIPMNNPNKLIISKNDFFNSLRRISIYANKTTHQVRLKIAGSELQISAEDLDFSNEANERLACDYQGEDMEIGFNARFLLEMLNNLDCESVELQLSAPNRAGILTPADKQESEDLLMLVMPVMLNNYA
ncbi:MAG TPA: DNA polymerase III subunit beta [Cytophagaceae bacterium]|jgi:DNA polymerase-3 subunit beta|nr:DNA polymerase III subunit beta [Cytophagaceae bacterium]